VNRTFQIAWNNKSRATTEEPQHPHVRPIQSGSVYVLYTSTQHWLRHWRVGWLADVAVLGAALPSIALGLLNSFFLRLKLGRLSR
jgi:hypothetical protein